MKHHDISHFPYSIILFDGICNFCDRSINFVIKKDKANLFRFAALQSEIGIRLNTPQVSDSIVLIKNGQLYTKSSAVLHILKELPGYKNLYYFIYVPRPIRDFFYAIISRSRYLLFGKKNSCMIPTEAIRQKFLDHKI